jgi:hypothetical protein
LVIDMDSTRKMLAAMALCCIVPMGFIIVMTSVVGVTLGWASALALGIVAAGVCVAIMVQHHRHEDHVVDDEAPGRLHKSH